MGKDGSDSLPFWPHSKLRLAALCGMASPLVGLVFVAVAIVKSPWFSFSSNALSDLGSWGEPGAVWFNAGVLLAGVFEVIFCLGLRAVYGSMSKAERYSIDWILSTMVFLALLGVFTVDYKILHFFAALYFFIFAPTGFIVLGAYWREVEGLKKQGDFSIIIGVIILVFLMAIFHFGYNGAIAIPELLAILTMSVWSVVLAWQLWLVNTDEDVYKLHSQKRKDWLNN